MTTSPPPLPAANQTKMGWNIAVAAVLTLLSFWMTIADFSYRGDLLFQTSASFLISLIVFALLFFTSLIVAIFPKRMIIGANLLLLCRLSYGFPLSMAMDSSTAARMTSVLLLILSLSYLVLSVKKMLRTSSRPWMQRKHTLTVFAIWILTAIISIPMLVVGAGYGVRTLLGDYTELSHRGITLVERVFEKNGQRVFLVGMMHVGDGNYYRDLKQRMNADQPAGEKRLVLMEGVSDRNKLLPKDFANGTTYARLAATFGLEAQKSLEPSPPSATPDSSVVEPRPPSIATERNGIVWQNADIDVSELEAHHQTLLLAMLGVISGGNIQEMLIADVGNATGEDLEDLFVNGLIGARNQILIDHFDAMASDFTEVYVPWGAAHLPDVEKRLIERGYEQVSETKRPIVAFWK
ncbi:hypothetical protein [Haloferula sp.]|uniref:hypothetical protein n=1 Tax=Haloferula sp. TaxID=2497595 RepID=UPI003C74E55B